MLDLIFTLKQLHVLGAAVLFGTGLGIAFFMWMAHRHARADDQRGHRARRRDLRTDDLATVAVVKRRNEMQTTRPGRQLSCHAAATKVRCLGQSAWEGRMATRHWLTIAVAVGASLAVTAAEAAPKKRGGAAPLAARGCTHPLGTLCLGITTTRGQTFAVYNPNPWMPLRIGANVYGRMVGNGNCGPGIEVSSWKADKKITCSDRR